MKITLKTIPDISHAEWQAQSQRFTKGGHCLNSIQQL